MSEINILPVEMLIRVFSWVPLRNLKKVVLASKRWRAVGEDPRLWTWCSVTVRTREDIRNLSIRRLQLVHGIRIAAGNNWEADDWEALLQALIGFLQLKKLSLRWNDLSSVDAEFLAIAVVNIEDVYLEYTSLTTPQITSILSHVEEHPRLKKLTLWGNDLSSVAPALLATAVTRLKDVDLAGTSLTTPQITSILSHVEEHPRLKKLTLGGNDLSSVDPALLARAVTRLQDVNLMYTSLTAPQITSILSHVEEHPRLKKLTLWRNDLSSVAPALLARAVTRLEYVDLTATSLTTPQITAILSLILEHPRLKKLTLCGNDLSSVDPALLARAVTRLQDVDLEETNLTTPQMTAILSHVQEHPRLKKLALWGNDLSTLDNALLVTAGARLNLDRLNLDV